MTVRTTARFNEYGVARATFALHTDTQAHPEKQAIESHPQTRRERAFVVPPPPKAIARPRKRYGESRQTHSIKSLAEGDPRIQYRESRAREQRSPNRTNRFRTSPLSYAFGALDHPMSPSRNRASRRHDAHTSTKPKTASQQHTAKCTTARTTRGPSISRDTGEHYDEQSSIARR